ncbi:hypothetical protein [Roseomonas sp. AR75]|uniref:hypothetical protein n=1 Tax=Roseomonas sp. AR75 TaxID=2562311 RepID=UPI0010C00F10|nr:hypothetical protein [Roseomonas sp. AR75]
MRHRLPALALGGVLLVAGVGALAQAEADRRLDAAIARLRAALPPEMRLEIGGRQVDPVTGRAVLTNVVLTDGKGRVQVPELRIADVSDTRVGSAEALRIVIQTPDGGSGEVARVMVAGLPVPVEGKTLNMGNLRLDALELDGARIEDPTSGAVRVERLQLRELRPDGVAAAALRGFEFRGAPQDNQFARIGRVELDAVTLPLANGDFDPNAFRAGRIEVEGAELRDQGQAVTLSLGKLALRDWQPGRATALGVEGLQVAAPAASYGRLEMTLARLEASGVDAVRTVEAVLTGVQMPDPIAGTPQRLLVEGLDTALEGQQVFSLARLLTEGALESGMARGGMVAEGLRITPPPGQGAWLDMLGYREIAGGLELRGSVPRSGGRMEIEPFRIAWNEAATLNIAAQLDNTPGAPAEGTAVDPMMTAAQFAAAQLAGMTVALRDHGLLGRVLAVQARQQRVPEAQLREQWAQMVLAMPLPGGQPPRRGPAPAAPAQRKGAAAPAPAASGDPIAPIREAVARFIRQPGTLEISVRPPRPVAFGELSGLGGGNPAQTIERLGLTVTAR